MVEQDVAALLTEHRVPYCLVCGQALNAYVELVVSLDLDMAVAVGESSTGTRAPWKEHPEGPNPQ